MRLEYLAEFVDLAQTLNFTLTAERQLLSESALSRHIKALEDELGVVLFERTSRRVRLSDHGRLLLPAATSITLGWTAYLDQLRTAKAQASASVTIGTNYYVGDLLAMFCARHPDVAVRQWSRGESSPQLLESLARGDCQLVVVVDPPPFGDDVDHLVLTTDSYVAALPAGHRLARRQSIEVADLATEAFISFPLGTDGDLGIKEICHEAGFEPRITFSADVGSSIASFVADGLGVTFLRRKTIAKMNTGGVAYVDLSPPRALEAVLCWRHGRALPPPAQLFLDDVRGYLTAHPDGV